VEKKQVIGGRILVGGVHPMPLSKAIRAGDWVFVSGQTAIDATGAVLAGGVEAQTRRVLEGIRAVLEEAGSALTEVVKTTVWLADPRGFWSFNRVYAEFFPEAPPARSTVRADLMLDCKVEIEALAYSPGAAVRGAR
jgi:2-iminobutanoate/2-iminopropanoate deaminase